MATLGTWRPGGCPYSALAQFGDLSLGSVVRFAWVFFRLLVHFQTKDRPLSDFRAAHNRDSARRVLAARARASCLCHRKANDCRQQPTGPILSGTFHATCRVGGYDCRRSDQWLCDESRVERVWTLFETAIDWPAGSNLRQTARFLSIFAACLRFAEFVADLPGI